MQGVSGSVRLNESEVAAKVVDDEVVLINLRTGVYYCMQGTAAQVWMLLNGGHPVSEIAAALSRAFGVDADTTARDVTTFVATLLSEELVVESDRGEVSGGEPAAVPSTAAYAPPVLEVFRDMADIFSLDPPLPEMPELARPDGERGPRE